MLENGFELIENFISSMEIEELLEEITPLVSMGVSGSIRNIEKKSKKIYEYSRSNKVIDSISQYLPGHPRLTRAIFFNKTADKNWLVTWHQDKTVAVSEKFNVPGWGPWSTKDGVLHVQPPVDVLNQMVTLRLHLDDTNLENGCLKVLPNSHQQGILSQSALSEYVSKNKTFSCIANKGAALIMRPHLIHSSAKGSRPSQRRILHLEYGSYHLPPGS
ncbi:phytanoyl-CoA dioxygenase family protein [Agarilytica rhodophyticola]|uniref:phytanoyl-CoA dioxygenase family protein n=1 Tax=Agarilytica rhodophyticola TaxID=1737490 RepID=UPI000B348868|nr:phytanoyl-CoA dioxygenase family protein [Agarilytica rhodophyticola]